MSEESLKTDNLSIKRIRVDQRSKGRMKLTIKLSKEEAEAYAGFQKSINLEREKGGEPILSEEEFAKLSLIVGLQSLERMHIERLAAELEKRQQEAEAQEPEIVEEDAESTETEE